MVLVICWLCNTQSNIRCNILPDFLVVGQPQIRLWYLWSHHAGTVRKSHPTWLYARYCQVPIMQTRPTTSSYDVIPNYRKAHQAEPKRPVSSPDIHLHTIYGMSCWLVCFAWHSTATAEARSNMAISIMRHALWFRAVIRFTYTDQYDEVYYDNCWTTV